MKKTALAVCAALTCLSIVGCGSGGSGSGGSGSGDQQQGNQQQSDKQGSDKGGGRGKGGGGQSGAEKLGDTAKLTGDKSGSSFEVGVAAVQDPAKSVQQQAPEGSRYVGVRIGLKNTGDTTVAGGSVDKGIRLRTNDGQTYRPKSDLANPAGKKSDKENRGPRAVPLAPGDTADRWLLFQVDDGKKPNQLVLGKKSPFTEKKVQWTLG